MYKKKSEEEKSEINHGVASTALQDINVYSEGFIFPH